MTTLGYTLLAIGCILIAACAYTAGHRDGKRRLRAEVREAHAIRQAAEKEMVRAVNLLREWQWHAIKLAKQLNPVIGARLEAQLTQVEVQSQLKAIAKRTPK